MSLILAVLMGAIVGLLINYFSDVLPVSRSITRPLCGECDQPYPIRDYLFSHSCPNCAHKRSRRSIIVLICAIAACIFLTYFPFSIMGFWASLPMLVFLGVIMVIDIEHRLVLIQTSIFGFIMFLIYGFFLWSFLRTILGALVGLLIMLLFYFLGKAFSKIVGKIRNREIDEVAFGFGDVCLGTILGLLTGWPSIIGVILIAFLSFGVFSLFYLLGLLITKRYQAFTSGQPFTLFLILGVFVIFFM